MKNVNLVNQKIERKNEFMERKRTGLSVCQNERQANRTNLMNYRMETRKERERVFM